MRVILTQEMLAVGAPGAVITVRDGYARNYLFPRGLAKPATVANVRVVEQLMRRSTAQAQAAHLAAQQVAERLATASCTIPVTVGEQEKLHGRVTPADIAEGLQREHGVVVDKRQVQLEAPMTKLGVYRVGIKLHPEVTVTVKVWVVKA